MRALALLLIALVFAAPAKSEEHVEERAQGRVMLGAHEQHDWRGVGRLNFGDGFCTGALVLPDVVVTAAHCLIVKRTGAKRLPERTHFVAGYRLRRHQGHRIASGFSIHPEYLIADPGALAATASDLALVKLREPLDKIEPFPLTHGLGAGDEVTILSYGRDRPEIPSIQSPCGVIARVQAIAVLDCDITYGVSGSPVFRMVDGEWRIVAVVTSMGQFMGEQRSFAVVLDSAIGGVLAIP
ncbi:MAG: trypsin-like serine protease [Pseudomonadota bacterium]